MSGSSATLAPPAPEARTRRVSEGSFRRPRGASTAAPRRAATRRGLTRPCARLPAPRLPGSLSPRPEWVLLRLLQLRLLVVGERRRGGAQQQLAARRRQEREALLAKQHEHQNVPRPTPRSEGGALLQGVVVGVWVRGPSGGPAPTTPITAQPGPRPAPPISRRPRRTEVDVFHHKRRGGRAETKGDSWDLARFQVPLLSV